MPLRNYTLFIVWQMKYLIWSYKVRCNCIRLIILYGNCCHWSLSVKLCLVMASLVRSLPCEIICDRRGRGGKVDEDVKPRCVNSVLCGPVGRRSNYTFCRSFRPSASPSVRLFCHRHHRCHPHRRRRQWIAEIKRELQSPQTRNPNWYHSKVVCSFLFAFHSNHGSISHHFRDKARIQLFWASEPSNPVQFISKHQIVTNQ